MGRVAIEKNIEAFLSLDLPGSKVVVGDGPDLDMLRKKYPEVLFTGAKFGDELASWVAAADAFVFPVTGPKDVIEHGLVGYLDEDLKTAVISALKLNKQDCIDFALQRSWQASTEVFADLMYNNSNNKASPKDNIISHQFWCL